MTVTLDVGPGKTYTTIASAVAQIPVSPTPLVEDFIILLHETTYNEAVILQNVITSPSAKIYFKKVKGHNVSWITPSVALTINSVNYVNIEGIFFDCSGGGNAITNNTSNEMTIKKCNFLYTAPGQVIILGAHNFIIENNIFNGIYNAITAALNAGPLAKIQNNTFYTPAEQTPADPFIIELDFIANTGTLEFKNNILSSAAVVGTNFIRAINHIAGAFTLSNNCYFTVATPLWDYNGTPFPALAAWAPAVSETASIDLDPLFVNPGSNFILQENSPCLNVGTVTSTTEDYFGATRPHNVIYDIGAIEGPQASIHLMVGSNYINPITRISYFN